jgi:hypothetical protein
MHNTSRAASLQLCAVQPYSGETLGGSHYTPVNTVSCKLNLVQPLFPLLLMLCCLLRVCRFESRWINVQIADDSPSMWLAGMGGSTIGVWAAHGEGQVLFPDAAVQAAVLDQKLAPIR